MVDHFLTLRSSTARNRPPAATRKTGELYVNYPDQQLGVIDTSQNPIDLLPITFFSTLTTYAVGAFVVQGGQLYRCVVAVTTPGPFSLTNWNSVGGSVSVGDTPPANAQAGALWYDSTAAELYVLYNDGNSIQWVIAVNQSGAYLPLNGGTMTGDIVLRGNATAALNPVTLQQVQGGYLPLTGGKLTGNLGVGGAPAAAAPAGTAIDFATLGQITSGVGTNGGLNLTYNAVWDGTNWRYGGADGATLVGVGSNQFIVFTAPSGAAGGVAAWVSLFSMSASAATFGVGNVTLAPPTGPATLAATANGAASTGLFLTKGASGQANNIVGKTGANNRWVIALGNTTAESGSNVGSDFSINNYDDNGNALTTPFSLNRANGAAAFSGSASFGGGTSSPNYTATQGQIVVAKGSATNPVIWMNDGGSNRLGLYFNVGSGTTTLVDVYSGASLGIDPGGSFSYSGGSGVAYKPNGGTWTAPSDSRIKRVLGDYELGLDQLMRIQPIRYVYKGNDAVAEGEPSPHARVAERETPFVGLVADDVMGVFPEMVSQREGFIDGQRVTDLKDLDTTSLIYALVNAVKTLAARVEALEGAR
jgi:hypothetical protein